MSHLYLIPQPAVREVWALAAPFLDKAEKRGGAMQTVAEWREECAAGKKQLWFVWEDETLSETGCEGRCDGAVVTKLIDTPTGKTCVIDAFGAGKGAEWFPLLATLEEWAKTQECNRVRVYGRIGWTEKLKDYALKGVILDKEL
jgi:hypothetical protein